MIIMNELVVNEIGTDLSVAVLLRQGQGVLTASSVTVSYVQCTIGRYAAPG